MNPSIILRYSLLCVKVRKILNLQGFSRFHSKFKRFSKKWLKTLIFLCFFDIKSVFLIYTILVEIKGSGIFLYYQVFRKYGFSLCFEYQDFSVFGSTIQGTISIKRNLFQKSIKTYLIFIWFHSIIIV